MRIRFTWFWAISFVAICCFSTSGWPILFSGAVYCSLAGAIALVTISMVGRIWCSLYIAGRKNEALVVHGPYSITRNPLYLFSWLGAIGITLGSISVILPILVGCGFLLYYPFVISSEEEYLRARYGSEYEAYVNRVPRFLPSIGLLDEPKDYSTHPIQFRKHLGDVIWFAFFLAGIQLIHAAHACKLLPTLFTLY
jgi:protein-S-isoprenylcysteine O-methyltransferase Ste14